VNYEAVFLGGEAKVDSPESSPFSVTNTGAVILFFSNSSAETSCSLRGADTFSVVGFPCFYSYYSRNKLRKF